MNNIQRMAFFTIAALFLPYLLSCTTQPSNYSEPLYNSATPPAKESRTYYDTIQEVRSGNPEVLVMALRDLVKAKGSVRVYWDVEAYGPDTSSSQGMTMRIQYDSSIYLSSIKKSLGIDYYEEQILSVTQLAAADARMRVHYEENWKMAGNASGSVMIRGFRVAYALEDIKTYVILAEQTMHLQIADDLSTERSKVIRHEWK